MSKQGQKSLAERRRDHNRDLIRRMRNGDSLKTVDSRASWFPPRPIIKKDPDALQKLYQTSSSPGTLASNSPRMEPNVQEQSHMIGLKPGFDEVS